MWEVEFRNGGQNYVGMGDDSEYLEVFRVGGRSPQRTPMRFPQCLKFLHEVEKIGEVRSTTMSAFTAKWGQPVAREDV